MADKTVEQAKKPENVKLHRIISKRILIRFFPGLAYWLRKKRWEAKWSRKDYAPGWMAEVIPEEIQGAVSENWFPPESTVLDIGCGNGNIAAWLAKQGYSVLGFDYAEAAIEHARMKYHSPEKDLEFQVMDVIKDAFPPGQYDVLLDRGCLHNIPEAMAPKYLSNMASTAKPGARFLLFYATYNWLKPGEAYEDVAQEKASRFIEENFISDFDIIRSHRTQINCGNDLAMPGRAFWMTRR